MFKDKTKIEIDGHVLIKDPDTDEILLDQHNAINFENMSLALVRLLANQQTASNHDFINKMEPCIERLSPSKDFPPPPYFLWIRPMGSVADL